MLNPDVLPNLDMALDAAPCGLFVVDMDGIIRVANAQLHTMFGYDHRALIGQSIEVLVPADLRAQHHQHREIYRRNPYPVDPFDRGDLRARHRDGSELRVDVGLTPFRVDEIQLAVGAVTDSGNRRIADDANMRLASIIESAHDAMISTDTDTVITSWNKAAEKLYGYTAAEVIGQPLQTLVPDDRQDEIAEIREQILRGEAVVDYETRRIRKDGVVLDVSIVVSPIWDSHGNVVGVSSILRDITQEKALRARERKLQDNLAATNDALVRSNEELRQFAYIASHDLREPLRSISNFMQLLKLDHGDRLDSAAGEYVDFAIDSAKRLHSMISNLHDYVCLDESGPRLAECDMRDILASAAERLTTLISDNGAAVEITGSCPSVNGNAEHLGLLFQNLISNAVKFRSDRPPAVTLRLQARAAQVPGLSDTEASRMCLVSVQDNGIGIDAEYLDRIFVMFQRLHTTAEFEGNGVGLAICRKIVLNHRGRIWAESAPGEGSCFHVALPRRHAPIAGARSPSIDGSTGSPWSPGAQCSD